MRRSRTKCRDDAIKTHHRHFYLGSKESIRSECQAAAPFVVWKGESGEKNGISLLCKAALAGKVVLL